MIDWIEMTIPRYLVIIKGNKGVINDKSLFIAEEDIYDITRIIRTWKESYKGNGINDSKYYINLFDKDNKSIGNYTFDGDYPDDFLELVDVIGNIYDRR